MKSEDGESREMDWILVDVKEGNTAIDKYRQKLVDHVVDKHNRGAISSSRTMNVSREIIGGTFVRSVGRTSGYQEGQLSPTRTLVFHGDHTTIEWGVLKRANANADLWVEGGIGVDGDSGASIVDADDGVYGMLWGRIGEEALTITLFTAMEDIFSDIRDQTGKRVEFVRGQRLLKPAAEDSIQGLSDLLQNYILDAQTFGSSSSMVPQLSTHAQQQSRGESLSEA